MLNWKEFKYQSSLLTKLGTPIMLGQLAQMSMGFVDTVVAGRAGATEMAGVAVGGAFWVPLLLFGQGMLNCIGPLVAQGVGAGKNKSLNRFWRQGMWLSFGLSSLLLFLFAIISQLILTIKSIEPALATVTSNYILLIMGGMPAFLLFFVCRFFLEGKGHTRPAMVAGFVGLCANIPLNYIFVFGYLGMPALGGAGCGLASAIVCWIMLGVMFFYVCALSPGTVGIVVPKFKVIKRIMRIGFPSALALLLEVSSFTMIALFIAPLGSVTVAGHQVAMNMSSLCFMIPLSLGIATSIRVGTCLGAGRMVEAVAVRKTGLLLSVVTGVLLSIFLFVCRVPIAMLYSIDVSVITLASQILFLTALYQVPDNMQVITLATLRGYNDTKAVFFICIISYWGISIPLGYMLCFTDIIIPAIGVFGFWVGLIVGLTSAVVLLHIRILQLEKLSPEKIKEKISR